MEDALPDPSAFLLLSFRVVVIVVAVVVAAIAGVAARRRRRSAVAAMLAVSAGIAVWLAVTSALAARGLLHFTRPPTMLALLVVTFVIAIAILRPRIVRLDPGAIPVVAIVALQAFRLPLELVMHRAAAEGVMPVQMSFAGFNFDILTGAFAPFVAALLLSGWPIGRAVARIWNVAGLLLLFNVLVIALLSAPTPLRMFKSDPPNVWVTHAPFVWLPVFLVPVAMVSHLVLLSLWRGEAPSATTSDALPSHS